ncbi:hypothetical protein [Priestia megaterium]
MIKRGRNKSILVKEDPNDESKFLMKNPTRSDFFMVMVNVGFIYAVASSG